MIARWIGLASGTSKADSEIFRVRSNEVACNIIDAFSMDTSRRNH